MFFQFFITGQKQHEAQLYNSDSIQHKTAMAEEVNQLLEQYKGLSAQLQALYMKSQQFVQQQSENNLVKVELDLLEGSAPVFKQVGPVLIRQNLDDAKEVRILLFIVVELCLGVGSAFDMHS